MPRLRLLLLLTLPLVACVRLGHQGDGLGKVLSQDARTLAAGDPAAPGPHEVTARAVAVGDWDDGFPVVLYRPADQTGPLPAIVFLPARAAPEWQYESWGRDLASHGFVVAMRSWYGFLRTDPELADDARLIARWLVDEKLGDPQRLGLAGHSMGGKSSILAALADPRFAAVVAIDPDENGRTKVARGPVAQLRPPLLVIGMEVAYKALRLCATPDGNFRSFFPSAPPGTIELTVLGADHVQVMDDPDFPGMGICRVGKGSSQKVRLHALGATLRFFERHLLGQPSELPSGDGLRQRIKAGPAAASAR